MNRNANATASGPALSPERARDVELEVDRLCGSVRKAAVILTFGDEPAKFAALLDRAAK